MCNFLAKDVHTPAAVLVELGAQSGYSESFLLEVVKAYYQCVGRGGAAVCLSGGGGVGERLVGDGGSDAGDGGVSSSGECCVGTGDGGCRDQVGVDQVSGVKGVGALFGSQQQRSSAGETDGVGQACGDVEQSVSVRGKNYARNRRMKEKRKEKVRASRDSSTSVISGKFSSCASAVQRELCDSYASRLIAENKAAEARASAYVARSALVKSSRVYETKFELGRQTLEDKLQKISDKRNGMVGVGGSRSGCALGTPATPSMTSGSVSPDSSVSIAEWHSMKKSYDNVVMELNSVKDEVNRMKKVDCVSKVQGEKEMTADILAGRATFLDSREDSVFRRDDVASYGDF